MTKDNVEHATVILSVIFSRLIYFVWQSVIKLYKKKVVVVHIDRKEENEEIFHKDQKTCA